MDHPITTDFPLHAVVDGLLDAVSAFRAVRDADGHIADFAWAYANDAKAKLTPYTREELLGRRLLDVFPEHSRSGIFDAYCHVVETGEPFVHPAMWRGADAGQRRAFEVRATKWGDGLVVNSREVTDDVILAELRELALEQERSVSQQLRELDMSRAALIAAVTHDLRTPLAGIVGLSWLLDSDWEEMDETTKREYVRDIVRSGEELDRRITSVLEHLKVETGRYEVELETCNVGDELAGAIDRMSLMLERYTVVFEVPEDAYVRADRTALARVFENLLSNAVKYAPEQTRVTVRAEASDDTVVISVIDEGPGISDEDAQRVFQQFERLESGKRVAYGNGVGLSAVRQLVELMDGSVWVERNDERGSAFRVALPVAG